MTELEALKTKYQRYLQKALGHLEKSYAKAKNLPTSLEACTDDQLEVWESFTSRFARVIDIFLTKYLRVLVIETDPGFDGTLKDLLNLAEKYNFISSATMWMSFREYRNIQAHDYTEESFQAFVSGLVKNTPTLLQLKVKLK